MNKDHADSETELSVEGELELKAPRAAEESLDQGETSSRPKQGIKLQSLRVPTSAQIQEAIADLRLATGSAAVLEFVINDTLADLRTYQSARLRKIRQDEWLTEPIGELETLLRKHISFLEAHPGIPKEILPAPTGEKLGELFSFEGISRALEQELLPGDGEPLKDYLEERGLPFDIASVEHYYARTREDYGLLHGDRLFLCALRVVHEPLKGWVAAKAANKGGRPANAERRHIIERLAKAAPYILGSDPPISIAARLWSCASGCFRFADLPRMESTRRL